MGADVASGTNNSLPWGEQFSKVPLLLSRVLGEEVQFLTFYHLLSFSMLALVNETNRIVYSIFLA